MSTLIPVLVIGLVVTSREDILKTDALHPEVATDTANHLIGVGRIDRAPWINGEASSIAGVGPVVTMKSAPASRQIPLPLR
jgi:hypothetical protein